MCFDTTVEKPVVNQEVLQGRELVATFLRADVNLRSESKFSVNLATAPPVNLANISVWVVDNAANQNFQSIYLKKVYGIYTLV